jgi:hypothetical protein
MKNKYKKYVLTKDIIIPSGTVLDIAPNNKGGEYCRHCFVEIGKDFTGDFLITEEGAISDSNGIIVKLLN